MRTWIALFRGINVGGKNMLPMKELAALLTGLGLAGVKTYLNSGNVVCGSPGVHRELLELVQAHGDAWREKIG